MAIAERFKGANTVDAGRVSPYWGEHAARYVFAAPKLENKRVLDIACGTGYGISILQRHASQVVGVDIDLPAAIEARLECDRRSSVLLADGLILPFDDDVFDGITSFETLEHLHQRPQFLSELSRVLKQGGKLFLSTPNALYSCPVNGVPTNPFHIHEYEPDELRRELENEFAVDEFLGQDLRDRTSVPPFYQAQRRLPRDAATQIRLFGWKIFNKVPVKLRETISDLIWSSPFYPTERDYEFRPEIARTAPTLVAICTK